VAGTQLIHPDAVVSCRWNDQTLLEVPNVPLFPEFEVNGVVRALAPVANQDSLPVRFASSVRNCNAGASHEGLEFHLVIHLVILEKKM
jgi:hypothetical protein